jgi:hypothetical protein
MRYLSRLCAVTVLACILAVPVAAGDISCGVTDPPPPPPQQMMVQGDIGAGVTGQISTTVTGEMSTGFISPTTDIFLSLLQSLLSLF